jgi:hypothetical protein
MGHPYGRLSSIYKSTVAPEYGVSCGKTHRSSCATNAKAHFTFKQKLIGLINGKP